MKKLIIPLVIVLLSGLIVLNYLAYKSPTIKKMISQQTIYQTKENELSIALYSNHKGPYQRIDAIESTYLSGDGKRLEVLLVEINKGAKYSYLGETFTQYHYLFNLPLLKDYYYIKEASLEIRLKNGKEMTFHIGSFDYYYQENERLYLKELHATKHEDAFQINEVTMKFELSENIFIHELILSSHLSINVGKEIDEGLVVSIPKQPYIIDKIALVIRYEKDGLMDEEVLPFYLFFDSIENVLDYGYLNHVYVLD